MNKPAGNRGKGRKAGVPNKVTTSIKSALVEAFDKRGGVTALVQWAQEDPSAFYKLWGSLAPKEMEVKATGDILVRFVRE